MFRKIIIINVIGLSYLAQFLLQSLGIRWGFFALMDYIPTHFNKNNPSIFGKFYGVLGELVYALDDLRPLFLISFWAAFSRKNVRLNPGILAYEASPLLSCWLGLLVYCCRILLDIFPTTYNELVGRSTVIYIESIGQYSLLEILNNLLAISRSDAHFTKNKLTFYVS